MSVKESLSVPLNQVEMTVYGSETEPTPSQEASSQSKNQRKFCHIAAAACLITSIALCIILPLSGVLGNIPTGEHCGSVDDPSACYYNTTCAQRCVIPHT